jgi:two-component system sensor histidine kinase HydH
LDASHLVTAVACTGHLAFAILAWTRRARSPLGGLLALLFFDAFAWNFAGLAYELSGARVWQVVDRSFSSLMAALAFHVVTVFVGRARQLGRVVTLSYLVFGGIALVSQGSRWWQVLLAASSVTMALTVWLLLRHRMRASDVEERTRTDLLVVAIGVGTLLSSTELWFYLPGFPLPRLGSAGTLFAMALFGVAALRMKLLGRDVPPIVPWYALLASALWVVLELAVVRWLDPRSGATVLGLTALAVLGFAGVRELRNAAALRGARREELATLGRFSEQLAHDLRNPLAALKGAVQFLAAEREQGRSLDGQARFLTLMLEQVGRMERVVADYQRVAKVEPALVTLSLNELVEGALSLQPFAWPGVELALELGSGLPPLSLDRDLLATVLENLVRNACEAMPDGGRVIVRTSCAEPGRVLLEVVDTGRGMDPRELERATDAFFTTKVGGSGIGLHFAERVARAHGGSLELTSAVGRGTVVSVSFQAPSDSQ